MNKTLVPVWVLSEEGHYVSWAGEITLIIIRYPWWLIGTKYRFTIQHQISIFPHHVGWSQGQSRSHDEWSRSFQLLPRAIELGLQSGLPWPGSFLSACCGCSISTGCGPLFGSPAHSQISNEAYLEVVSCQLRCTLPHLSAPSCPSYLFFFRFYASNHSYCCGYIAVFQFTTTTRLFYRAAVHICIVHVTVKWLCGR